MEHINTWTESVHQTLTCKQSLIRTAAGQQKAELVLKNASYVNVFSGELLRENIAISQGVIVGLGLGNYEGVEEIDLEGKILCPGFIDAHIHLESSLVSPDQFARAVIPHGTTAVITDPHEITNVMGTQGIDYMLRATEGLPLSVYFMIPSCVPASPQDESGASLTYQDLDGFYAHPRVLGLAEMMDFPGILAGSPVPVEKVSAAQLHGKRIDGHAPGLQNQALNAYAGTGIASDHECADPEDALLKLRRGQYIMIREGTAARNLEALMPLLLSPEYSRRCLLCTDDKHPNDLLERGHIDFICREAVRMGADPMRVIQAATLHAAQYFGLSRTGAIAPGYQADLCVLEDLTSFKVCAVYKSGKPVYERGTAAPFPTPEVPDYLSAAAHDTFHLPSLSSQDFHTEKPLPVLGMVAGQILTEDRGTAEAPDTTQDILKMAVIERHHSTGHIGLGYLQGYGLKSGAIATSVAHDSHNIICVGINDSDMAFAANRIAENHGGIVVVEQGRVLAELPLEIAGLMTEKPLPQVNALLENAKAAAHKLGVADTIDPFMTLSFMSLPVIPTLRLTTRGVFDVIAQKYK